MFGGDHGVNATPNKKVTFYGHDPRVEELNEIIENVVGDLFVKVPFVSERPKIELQALELHAPLVWRIANPDGGEVWLAGFGA